MSLYSLKAVKQTLESTTNLLDTQEVKMNIFIPMDIESSLRKSNEEGKGEQWYVRGYASTPDLDLQGDIVQPSGIDIEYFKKHGWLNYEHKQDAKYAIGTPTDNCYIDFQKGLFVEAKLFQDNPFAQEMWALANSLQKSGDERKLGFSIEGGIRKRNERDNRIVEELIIKNVAITKSPANPNATWETFMKSWTTGHETNPDKQINGSALRTEELAQAITSLTWTAGITSGEDYSKTWKDIAGYLETADRSTEESGILLLQLSKGISRDEATKFIKSRNKK